MVDVVVVHVCDGHSSEKEEEEEEKEKAGNHKYRSSTITLMLVGAVPADEAHNFLLSVLRP